MRDLLALLGPEKFAAAVEIITRRSANAIRCERYKQRHPMSRHACPDMPSAESVVYREESKKEDKKERKNTAPRGTRLPSEWTPSQELLQFGWREFGHDGDTMRQFADEFRDYFHAAPGAKGLKLDWNATFRNWIRRDLNGRGKAKVQRSGRKTIHSVIDDLIERDRRGESIALFPDNGDAGDESLDRFLPRLGEG